MLYILPDSAGDLLVIQASEILNSEDFAQRLLPAIEQQLKPTQALRLVLYFDHQLETIDSSSPWQAQIFAQACPCDIKGIAVVGDPKWQAWQQALTSVSAHFSESQFLQALHWIDDL